MPLLDHGQHRNCEGVDSQVGFLATTLNMIISVTFYLNLHIGVSFYD